MPATEANLELEFPDDPLKWDGWSKYRAANPYERLCLDPASNPDDEQIQQHCSALLLWWQKKLRLKNQPSNPLAQLLGRGLDEAGVCLVEARMQLLDPERRRQIDEELATNAQQEALAEFAKYVSVALARRLLTAEAEAHLVEFGQRSGLTEDETRACIEQEFERRKAKRVTTPSAEPAKPAAATEEALPLEPTAEAEREFYRFLSLSQLDLADATALVRRIFATVAENLGIHLERAEHLLEDYLESAEYVGEEPPAKKAPVQLKIPAKPKATTAPAAVARPLPIAPRVQPSSRERSPSLPEEFTAPSGTPMVLIPGGDFIMGCVADDAAPNERPLTPVTLAEFYMSRFPVTNGQYELFDPSHKQKRLPRADASHPVVYVSSVNAIKYCEWLGQRDGKKYRLPTEAEWEYAARGTDERKYPWGEDDHRGDLANFADASTTFAWREARISDGYPETSPVGAYPRGVSFFGLGDMAGNVWEWCLDFYHPLPGPEKRNQRSTATGTTRVYRGGSWKSRFTNLRTTARSSNAANFASNDVGFRIVCECPPDAASPA
jgi:formylglycine-generating enzyme required for sulfatase activity